MSILHIHDADIYSPEQHHVQDDDLLVLLDGHLVLLDDLLCRLYGKQQDVNTLRHSSRPCVVQLDPL